MNRETIHVERRELLEAAAKLVENGARLLTMVASDEWSTRAGRFVLRYAFALESSTILVLQTDLPEEDPSFPSLANMLPAASWYEREARDLLGVQPVGHPDPRGLVLHDDFPEGVYPLRKDYPLELMQPRRSKTAFSYPLVQGEGVYEVPVGPIHAGVIEPGHFRFQVMGDSVLHLEARVFYAHRGLEKRSEGMSIADGRLLAEQICGVCSASNTLAYAQAVEQLAGVEAPERALFMRSLVAEMERMYSHVGDIGNICAGIGFAYGSNHGARLKETLMQLNDRMIGHRYLRGMIVPGGVARELSDGQLREIARVATEVGREIGQIAREVEANRIAFDRLNGTGLLEKGRAAAFGTVGPAARASGIDTDSRRDFPHGAYAQLHFQVPVLEEGDVLARFRMRALEVEQSVGLLRQIANSIPGGAIRAEIGDLPAYRYGIGIAESPRGENVHFLMTGERNTIYRYRIRSASYANWPIVASCAPGNILPDFPLINKSFELCYACCDR